MLDVLRAVGMPLDKMSEPMLRAFVLAMSRYAQPIQVVSAGEPPADWHSFSASVLDRFRDRQREALGLFGRGALGPFALEELPSLIDGYAQEQQETGREADLEYPEGVFRTAWSGPRDMAPLYRLVMVGRMITHATLLPQHAVVEFLLADHKTSLPWIVVRGPRSQPGYGMCRVTIEVNSLEVLPSDVAAEYARALPDMRSFHESACSWDAIAYTEGYEPPRYRRSRVSTQVATKVDFVNAWKRERGLRESDDMPYGSWPEVAKEFGEAYPSLGDAPKPGSLCAQYQREMSRRRGADDGKA